MNLILVGVLEPNSQMVSAIVSSAMSKQGNASLLSGCAKLLFRTKFKLLRITKVKRYAGTKSYSALHVDNITSIY